MARIQGPANSLAAIVNPLAGVGTQVIVLVYMYLKRVLGDQIVQDRRHDV